ncbi:hypothetical protein ABID49_002720 [Bhargavaea ullalensis]|uniref:O-antigen ligase like membrane protein n=1 Tax=Bhargavaea ullalensis TaxID=1265685 RepID=A0ABV2GEQ7_9BACL
MVRVIFLAYVIYFVLRHFITNKQWKPLIGIGALGLYFLIGLLINFFLKDPFSIGAEITFLTKTIYPIFLFIAFYIIFKENFLGRDRLLKVLTINAIVVSAIIILPTVFGISFESYNSSFAGSIGWFNAANETGAILVILFAFTVLFYLKSRTWDPAAIIAIVGMTISVYLIGTKVATGSFLMIALCTALLFMLKKNWMKSVVILVALAGTLYGITQSPVAQNAKVVEEQNQIRQDMYKEKEKHFTADIIEQINMYQEYRKMSNPMLTQVLSSRDLFFLMHYDFFKEAHPLRKAFGMGYSSEYEKEAKMVEMDYFDFVFSYGLILGLALTVAMIFFIFKAIKTAITELFRKNRDDRKILIAFSSLLVLGVSFIAGHIWFAPAVSLYFMILLAMMYNQDPAERKQTVQ